jgi:hypothetical protein
MVTLASSNIAIPSYGSIRTTEGKAICVAAVLKASSYRFPKYMQIHCAPSSAFSDTCRIMASIHFSPFRPAVANSPFSLVCVGTLINHPCVLLQNLNSSLQSFTLGSENSSQINAFTVPLSISSFSPTNFDRRGCLLRLIGVESKLKPKLFSSFAFLFLLRLLEGS